MRRALRRAGTRGRIGSALMALGVAGFAVGAAADFANEVVVRLLPEPLASLHPQKVLYWVGPVLFGAGTLLRRSARQRMARLRATV